jgi:hypothetical protein
LKLAALGTLLGTVAWSPAAFDASGSADRTISAQDNSAVRALMPGTLPTATPELPWFLSSTGSKAQKSKNDARQVLSQQGLKFTENRGQATDGYGHKRSDVLYYGGTKDAQLFLTRNGIGYAFYAEPARPAFDALGRKLSRVGEPAEKRHVMQMELIGSNPQAQVSGQEQTPGVSNFIQGQKSEWLMGVPSYHKVLYRDIYKNIDMVVTTQNSGIKYDFIVKPGGDPSQIRFRYSGTEKVGVTVDGKLHIATPVGTVEEQQPYTYQGQTEVKNAYTVNNGVVSFKLGAYDASKTLVIDPTTIWATFFGGSGTDEFRDVEFRASDGIFVAVGRSNSQTIPSAGTPRNYNTGAAAGAIGTPGNYIGSYDALIAEFNDDNSLAWFTYFGGINDDEANGVEVDGNAIYVIGTTMSKANVTEKFPQTGTVPQAAKSNDATRDAFVACFTTAGVLTWDSYKGGNGEDYGMSISFRVKPGGGRIIAGTGTTTTGGTGLPTTSGGVSCSGFSNPLSNAYKGGTSDAFVFRWVETVNAISGLATGATERWSTYLGGAATDEGTAVELDSQSNVLVGGSTESVSTGVNAFPAVGGPGVITTHFTSAFGSQFDGYMGKFDTNGCLQVLGYLGGSGNDNVSDGAIDALDRMFLMGTTLSDSLSGTLLLPVGVGQRYRGNSVVLGDGSQDAFMAVMKSSTGTQPGVVDCATYHGGSEADYGTDCDVLDNSVAARQETIILVGYTQSSANSPNNGGANGGIPTSPGDNQCLVGASPLQANLANPTSNTNDWWMACFSPACCRLWSSFYGGNDNDFAYGISTRVAGTGAQARDVVVVVGQTYSDGLPGVQFPVMNSGGAAFFQGSMATDGRPDAALLKFSFAADEKLPIELSSFGATLTDNGVVLDWRTASEDNNAGFEVERATLTTPYDKVDFKRMATYLDKPALKGLGTSPIGKNYVYTDNDGLQSGKIYLYRLVDISEDGTRTAHSAVSVRLDGTVIEPVHVFKVDAPVPNPASNNVSISFTLQEADAVTIEIYSVDGKKISTPIVNKAYDANPHTESFSVATLAPGVYTAVVSTHSNNSVRTRQFVVVR